MRYQPTIEELLLRATARERANLIWELASPGPHRYLDNKGICQVGTRVFLNRLVVPMTTIFGEMTSVQYILESGKKLFMKGGEIKGKMRWLTSSESDMRTIYVCEGYATGATIFAATRGKAVAVAFVGSNLPHVAKAIRDEFPLSTIVICGDNDHENSDNSGLKFAYQAAEVSSGVLIFPVGIKGTDFNDVQNEKGIHRVSQMIEDFTYGKIDQRNKRRVKANSHR